MPTTNTNAPNTAPQAAAADLLTQIRSMRTTSDEAITHLFDRTHGPIAYCAGFRDSMIQAERVVKEHDSQMVRACEAALQLIVDTWPKEHGQAQVGTVWGILQRAIEGATGKPPQASRMGPMLGVPSGSVRLRPGLTRLRSRGRFPPRLRQPRTQPRLPPPPSHPLSPSSSARMPTLTSETAPSMPHSRWMRPSW